MNITISRNIHWSISCLSWSWFFAVFLKRMTLICKMYLPRPNPLPPPSPQGKFFPFDLGFGHLSWFLGRQVKYNLMFICMSCIFKKNSYFFVHFSPIQTFSSSRTPCESFGLSYTLLCLIPLSNGRLVFLLFQLWWRYMLFDEVSKPTILILNYIWFRTLKRSMVHSRKWRRRSCNICILFSSHIFFDVSKRTSRSPFRPKSNKFFVSKWLERRRSTTSGSSPKTSRSLIKAAAPVHFWTWLWNWRSVAITSC